MKKIFLLVLLFTLASGIYAQSTFKINERAEALYSGDGKWYTAVITSDNLSEDGTYGIRYEVDNYSENVTPDKLRKLKATPTPATQNTGAASTSSATITENDLAKLLSDKVHDELTKLDLGSLKAFYGQYVDSKFQKSANDLSPITDPKGSGKTTGIRKESTDYQLMGTNLVYPVFYSMTMSYKSISSHEYFGAYRFALLDGELIYYQVSENASGPASLFMVTTIYTTGKPLLKTPNDYFQKVQKYEAEKLALQSIEVANLANRLNAQAESAKKENSLNGKNVSKLTIVAQTPATFGLGTKFILGVSATLANGKELKTKEIGGGTYWDDYQVTVEGGTFDASTGKIKIAGDAAQIKNDQLVITVKSVEQPSLTKTEKISIPYNAPAFYDYSGSSGKQGGFGSNGTSSSNGGHGKDGQSGSNGSDLTIKAMACKHKQTGAKLLKIEITGGGSTEHVLVDEQAGILIYANGGNGGSGGGGGNGSSSSNGYTNGGDGGNGGNGGNGGTITLTSATDVNDQSIKLKASGGNGGSAGSGGSSNAKRGGFGSGGKGGTAGDINRTKGTVKLDW